MHPRIRLAQTAATLGNLDANLERHLSEIANARAAGIDLIVFPELSLTGYFLKDQTAEVALERDAPVLQRLAQASQEISLAVGFVERARDGQLFNAMGFFEDGRLLAVHRKVHLVTYGMFEEDRDLGAGERFEVIESKLGRFGFLTCEDAWHMDGAYLYFLAGVDALIVASAGPGRGVEARSATDEPDAHAAVEDSAREPLGSNRTWHTLQDALALWTRTPVLYVNRVGWEDGIFFSGSTRAVAADATPMGRALGLDAGHLDVQLDAASTRRARESTPLRRDERPWILLRGLSEHVGLEGARTDSPSGADSSPSDAGRAASARGNAQRRDT